MASVDAFFQTILFYRLLPFVVFIAILRWIFKIELSMKRIQPLFQNPLLRLIHYKLSREKHLLFDQFSRLDDYNYNVSGGRPIRFNTKLLEIGVGSGNNFNFYPKGTVLTLLDPNPYYEEYVKKSIQKSTNKFVRLDSFVQGFAEDMSMLEDNSFDFVVCTLVLCTVKDQDAVLQEIQRLLKTGGKFYFLEHVAAKKGTFGRWIQEKLDRIHYCLSDGCHLNRETWSSFDKVKFKSVNYREFSLRIVPGISLPCIYGTAS